MKKRILSLVVVMTMLCAFAPMLTASAATINIGDYVQMGTYYGEPILWRCVDKDDNGPLILADKIICIKAFDAKPSANTTTGSHSRRLYDSNYWGDSNMRSWLNSNASAGEVEWLCGNPPDNDHVSNGYNDYAEEAGFMTNFTTGELNAVKEVTQKSILSTYDSELDTTGATTCHYYVSDIEDVVQNYDDCYAENVTDKFFLLDVKQVNAVYNNSDVLGEDYYIGEPTEQCVANSEYKDEGYLEAGEKWHYWLRSPHAHYTIGSLSGVRNVYSSGNVNDDYAYASRGVRPAFYLAENAKITSGSGTSAAPYTVEGTGGGGGNTNSTSNGAPIITSATVDYNNTSHDLFNQTINIDEDSTTSYSVKGEVDANGCTDVHLYITQGAKTAIEIPLDTGKDIQIGKEFSTGQPIYMTAIDKKTGKSTSKRTKLSVVGNGMFEGEIIGGDINLFSDFMVNLPEGSVPILSGKYGLSLGSVSTEVEIDGNEFKASLGTDFLEGKKDSDGKWKKEAWEGFKTGFKNAKEKMRTNADGYKYLKNIAPKKTKLEMSNETSGKANVTGYLEGYIDDSGVHPTEGGVIVSAEIKYKYKGMTLVSVVPLYYEIEAGGGVEFVGGVKDLLPGNGLQGAFTGSLTPSASFEAGGGVGVPLVFTAGISGKVKAELEIALNKVYQKFDVTGTANFKLKGPFGIPTYEKSFAKGTFHVYETGNKNTLLGKTLHLYSLEDASNNMYAVDIDAPIELAPHDDSTQDWVGDTEHIQLFVADYTNQTVNVLEENSYENIAPVFAKMGGKNVITWITDNKSRAEGDKTMLVYSVEENGKWSAPVAVYDDGLADYAPVMKDGYIVWQKAVDNITADMTARDLGAVCEIYMAKWNGSGFDAPVRITENSLTDQTPTLTVNNGIPTVVWVQNSENDFTGLTGENRIMSYTDGEASTEQSINDAVTYLDCAYIDDELYIAYETDSDKDLSTLEDREIYTVTNGSQSQITNNTLIDTHPVYADFNGNKTLFYYSDGKIVYLENGSENIVKDSGVSTDQFTVVSNSSGAAVLWTAVNDGTAEIHGALYDGTEWSEDVQISDLGQRVKYPSAVMNEDGSIFAVFNRTEKVSDGDDYYVEGQSDLCTINVVPSYDLELTDAYFDEDSMTAYATVKNNGELAVDGYTVSLTDDAVNASQTVTEPLKAGDSAEIELTYNKPENLTKRDIELSVVMTGGEEYDAENNVAVFSIGNSDIAVDNVAVDEDETTITADISNIGYDDADTVTVQLRDGSADGAVIEEKTVNLAVGAAENIEFTIDKSTMRFFDATKQLYVTASGDFDEVSLGNNDGYVLINSLSGSADYETEILSYNEIDGKYVINSIARNNTDTAVSCVLYSAVYSDGTLKACGTVTADIDADNDTGVDITVPCTIETGDNIKTFMWTDKHEPLAKMSELTIE